MGGLLSRFSGAQQPVSDPGGDSAPLAPILSSDVERRAGLLDSLERSNLGWFWASDKAGRLIYLSEPAADRLSDQVDELLGTKISELFLDDEEAEEAANQRPLKFQLAARNSLRPTIVKLDRGGKTVWWEISGAPRQSGDDAFSGYHGIARDVTATIASQRDAEKMSRYDALTGLANRHRITHKLEATLTSFQVAKRSCATILLDLDRFKQVNDTMGHPAGDELLKQVSQRLTRIVGDQGEIGRLGGDEFQVLLPDVEDRAILGDLSERIIQMLSQPYSINGMRAVIGCSIGVAVAPFDGIESEELIKAADLALYAAKGGGRGQFRFYSTDLRDQASHRHQIEEDLRDALSKNELEMHFQPIVSSDEHRVVCAEALMRWNHSDRGMISPADFIPVAEEVGIIRELGEWAINDVCQKVAKWPGGICAAVNVSAVQFASDTFIDVVKKALQNSGVEPSQIELEITESVFVGDIDRALRMFRELKEIGVRLALDDFGTGYSSLSYLRDAPFDKIKIDQSFVRGCTEEGNNNGAIVSAVVSLAKALNMETVAEGVETKDELEAVVSFGASRIQGAIFSRAIPEQEFSERLQKGDLLFEPKGPEKYRSDRRTEFRKVGLIHEDSRYSVFLRNLSKTGAKIEGLLDVPIGTDVVLDLGGGQLAVAKVRRSEGFSQGVEFETHLVSDGAEGLCTRHRVSPYQIEAAGRPLGALNDIAVAAITGAMSKSPKAFIEVDMNAQSEQLAG
ncbi:EAL domain-containing protein [Erythrobacter crassostreae]|uniref:EAL domain-containing protein n=1 Tax=Erythrobacter crassostreae TaxID=2828328 RepID=A0A9X1F4H9_9SPHN|nr:EAL domain-containing protein [Erythrobacter crassostrea]MBV7260101.1 EAL domain-containing protein [Erythrobacter crassostrea]